MTDQGSRLEKLIKDLFLTLDKTYQQSVPLEQYASGLLPQLKEASPVILNGNPIGGKTAFQQHWLKFPLTQHNVTALDYHIIPGTNTLIVNVSGKVRFDESGKTRLGETADLDVGISVTPATSIGGNRAIWSSWFAFYAIFILDDSCFNGPNAEMINSLNWRIVFKPDDAVITL